jgi:Rrf2 family protein
MLLSRKCIYGLRAVLCVAQNNDDGYVSIREISEKLKISFHFLTKILQILTQNQIMISYRGPNGGINLAKSKKEITILDIVQLIDGDQIFQECILGLPNCNESNPCPLHESWTSSCQALKENFSNMTIEDLVHKIKESNLRISAE